MKPHWSGVFPAITTQLKRDQSLDLDGTARHLEALLKSGVTGMIMLGSLGENQTLEPEEKRQVLELAVKVVGGRVPVLSGVENHRGRPRDSAENPEAKIAFAELVQLIKISP